MRGSRCRGRRVSRRARRGRRGPRPEASRRLRTWSPPAWSRRPGLAGLVSPAWSRRPGLAGLVSSGRALCARRAGLGGGGEGEPIAGALWCSEPHRARAGASLEMGKRPRERAPPDERSHVGAGLGDVPREIAGGLVSAADDPARARRPQPGLVARWRIGPSRSPLGVRGREGSPRGGRSVLARGERGGRPSGVGRRGSAGGGRPSGVGRRAPGEVVTRARAVAPPRGVPDTDARRDPALLEEPARHRAGPASAPIRRRRRPRAARGGGPTARAPDRSRARSIMRPVDHAPGRRRPCGPERERRLPVHDRRALRIDRVVARAGVGRAAVRPGPSRGRTGRRRAARDTLGGRSEGRSEGRVVERLAVFRRRLGRSARPVGSGGRLGRSARAVGSGGRLGGSARGSPCALSTPALAADPPPPLAAAPRRRPGPRGAASNHGLEGMAEGAAFADPSVAVRARSGSGPGPGRSGRAGATTGGPARRAPPGRAAVPTGCPRSGRAAAERRHPDHRPGVDRGPPAIAVPGCAGLCRAAGRRRAPDRSTTRSRARRTLRRNERLPGAPVEQRAPRHPPRTHHRRHPPPSPLAQAGRTRANAAEQRSGSAGSGTERTFTAVS